ncbi:MAG: integration host factor subunit alpha [Oligoflexales bacterium]|nr:integration host factor subunit alpha [Oligoflexales bacterium]
MRDKPETLTKERICDQVQKKLGFSPKESKDLLEMLLEEMKLELEGGNAVKISGFGKWAVKAKRSRPGRNPHTGQKLEISSRSVVTFHPSDKIRALVNDQTPGTGPDSMDDKEDVKDRFKFA